MIIEYMDIDPEIRSIKGDGACLFSSVHTFLTADGVDLFPTTIRLRQRTCDLMELNPEYYSPFLSGCVAFVEDRMEEDSFVSAVYCGTHH